MANFLIKKLLYSISILFGVVTLVFFLFQWQMENPVRMLLGNRPTQEMIDNLEREMGLDLPVHKQYLLYINDLSPVSINSSNSESHVYFNEEQYSGVKMFSVGSERSLYLKWPYLRQSYKSNRPVASIISKAMPTTAILAFSAILLASILGIGFGVISSLFHNQYIDKFLGVFSIIGMSGPSYFIGIIMAWLFGFVCHETTELPLIPFAFLAIGIIYGKIKNKDQRGYSLDFNYYIFANTVVKFLSWGIVLTIVIWIISFFQPVFSKINITLPLPGTGLNPTGGFYDSDDYGNEFINWGNLILPALTLSIAPIGIFTQLTRNSMLEVLSSDFIRTAKAKGLGVRNIVLKHALRNALSPVVTAISGWFASLLAGALFVEIIFSWNGIGSKMYAALEDDDLPLLMGVVVVISVVFVIINMIVDSVYGMLDPRIRRG
jgi:ABC-type dipeptide/oligopeptide/nickel transport system permease component